MENIIEYVTGLTVGEPQTYRNMAVFPLMGKSSGLDYLLFDEAMNAGLKITETGSVPTLHFTNNTGKKVLIMQGEYAVGGKQNRMIATNVLMANGFDGEVPVKCVQHGRWSSPGLEGKFFSANRRAPQTVMMADGQQEVWSEVHNLSVGLGVKSATGDIEDSFSQRSHDVEDYTSNFDYVPGSVGIVVFVANKGLSIGADIFDKQSTMRKNFNKIVESYALEAIASSNEHLALGRPKGFVSTFLEKIGQCQFHERTAVSLGRDFRLVGPISGFALDNYGVPLYVTLSSTKAKNPIASPRFETGFSRGNVIID